MSYRRGQCVVLLGVRVGWWAAVALASLAVALTACVGGSEGGPAITEFVVEPATAVPGQTVVLRWEVEHLDDGRLRLESLNEGAVEPTSLGDVTAQTSTAVVVEETTTFRLVASGSGGTASSETKVSVESLEPPPDPPEISFFRATPDSPVGWGEPVLLEWEVSGADSVTIDPPGDEVDAAGTLEVTPLGTTTYTLTATNDGGSKAATVTVEVDTSNRLLFLVAGQSNASGEGLEEGGEFPTDETEQGVDGVMMLTRDLDWVRASEPSHPPAEDGDPARHSFLVRFGNEVKQATDMDVFLVPAAVGGSALHDWEPGDDHFREAVARARYASNSLGIPVSAIIWYQGESDTKTDSRRDDFVDNTNVVLDGLRGNLAGPPVIFAQLSKRLWSDELDEPGDNVQGHNLAYQIVREWQRLMEVGSRAAEVDEPGDSQVAEPYYMAVTHDLPMSDAKHISAEGQRVLGERIAGVYLSCIWRACAQPPGPRLEKLTVESGLGGSWSVLVDLSKPVNSHSTYDGYFGVFVDGEERIDFTIRLSPGDQSVIRLEFASGFPAGAEVEVRYMPPEGTPLYERSDNAVKAQANGLPLPAFGMPVEAPPEGHIPGLRLPDD